MNRYQLASEALVLLGGTAIASFDGAGTQEIIAATLYEPTVLGVVTIRRWRCMTRQVILSRLAAPPAARWAAAYELPADAQTIHGLTINDHPLEFDRYENMIFCDAQATDQVALDYTYRASEAYWPGYFADVVRLKLASMFAIPLTENVDKAKIYDQLFTRAFAMARSIEGQGRTAQRFPVGRLRAYHRGRP